MDLLTTAVVDITTLVATCHALKCRPATGNPAGQHKLRSRLRHELKLGTLAYIETLARSRSGLVDDSLLAACRVAAEQVMAQAITHQDLLGHIMTVEPGSLDGLAVARQDLWRLAHMTIHLRIGTAALRESGPAANAASAGSLAARLRRRFRKALIAYARATLRTKERRRITTAREAALAEIGKRGAAEARRLADIEVGGDPTQTVIRLGVARPLVDLALDWQRREREGPRVR